MPRTMKTNPHPLIEPREMPLTPMPVSFTPPISPLAHDLVLTDEALAILWYLSVLSSETDVDTCVNLLLISRNNELT